MNQIKNTIAVVVGSGGIKPLGVTKFYDLITQKNVEPDLIIGCSSGAVASACWAAGFSIEKCDKLITDYVHFAQHYQIFKDLDVRTVLSLLHLPGGQFSQEKAILKKDKLLHFLEKMFGDLLLENLPIKMLITATDLESGQQVALEKGSLASAVYASLATYPLLPPIQLNNRWLVDGSYSCATPTLLAVNLGYDKIITLSYSEKDAETFPSFSEFMNETMAKILRHHARCQNAVATYMHHDEILFINFDFDEIIDLDDKEMIKKINTISEKTVHKFEKQILEMFGLNHQDNTMNKL